MQLEVIDCHQMNIKILSNQRVYITIPCYCPNNSALIIASNSFAFQFSTGFPLTTECPWCDVASSPGLWLKLLNHH